MSTFAEKKNEFDSTLGQSSILKESSVPVNGEIRENVLIRNNEGQRLEEYYKWQFIYSVINSGLYQRGFIGIEVSFPKGNPLSKPIKLDAAIFDRKEWITHYKKFWREKKQSSLDWLRNHLIVAIEFKNNEGRNIKKYFNQQLKPAIKESEKDCVFGIYYDAGKIWIFQKRNNKILRYDDSKNQKGENNINELSLESSDDYSIIPSFEQIIDRINREKFIEPINEETEKTIHHLRRLSVDRLIKEEGEGIVDIPLLGFRLKKEEIERKIYEPYSESLENALRLKDPIIIFGHGGQGKTILATEIAKKFLEGRFGEYYRNYIPIILNCGDLNNPANKNRDLYGDPKIKDLVMEYIYCKKIPEPILSKYKVVFILDDYHKLSPDYTKELEDTISNLINDKNITILLSRLEITDMHPPHNPGYITMQIDTEFIARQNDDFINGRIPSEYIEKFKEYLGQYDSSITGYYITKLFLAMIFIKEGNVSRGIARYITNSSIVETIRAKIPLKRTSLYDAQTDYIIGCDIHKDHPGWGVKQVKNEIITRKGNLEEKALRDLLDSSSLKGGEKSQIIESSLLYNKGHGIHDFIHDSYREFFLTKWFADKINKGDLSVRDAYIDYWSYIEDKELWSLDSFEYKDCRALLPAWKPILLNIIENLGPGKAEELVNQVSHSFFATKKLFDDREYNPFDNDRDFAAILVSKNDYLRLNNNSFIDRSLRLNAGYNYNEFKLSTLKKSESIIEDRGWEYKSTWLVLTKNRHYAQETLKILKNSLAKKYCVFDSDLIKVLCVIGDDTTLPDILDYVFNRQKSEDWVLHQRFSIDNFILAKKIAGPFFRDYISDDSNPDRARVIYYIERIKDIDSLDVLKKCLSDDDKYIRRAAFSALANIFGDSIVNFLTDYYITNRSDRGDLIGSFSKMDHPLVLDTLLKLSKNVEDPERHSIIFWLGNMTDNGISQHLINLYPTLKDDEERKETITVLMKFRNKDSIPFLIETLISMYRNQTVGKNNNSHLGERIIDALYNYDDEQLFGYFRDLGWDWEWYLSHFRIEEFVAKIGGKSILNVLKEHLMNGSLEENRKVIDILSNIKGDESFLELLYPFLDSPNKSYVAFTARAIGKIGSKKAVPVLIRKLKEKEPVYDIAYALAEINDPSSVDSLGEHVLKIDTSLFYEIQSWPIEVQNQYNFSGYFFTDPLKLRQVIALAKMKNPKSIPYLIEYFNKCPTADKIEASEGLAVLGYQPIIHTLKKAYSFREGLGDYGKYSTKKYDDKIIKIMSSFHSSIKPKGYVATQKMIGIPFF